MQVPSDEELMLNVAKGELDNLSILFDRHHLHVFNFLYKMSNDKALSEDITQDVFYKILKYRESYNGGTFVSWMFSIARNSLKNSFKRNNKVHMDLIGIEYKLGDDSAELDDDTSHLHMALTKLSKSDRELITLNKIQKIRYNELAELLGSSPGAIRTKVSRAIHRLKSHYFETL